MIQFLPGFGCRKAGFFSAKLAMLSNPKEINSRHKLIEQNILPPNLLMNSIAFLKFFSSPCLLDSTIISVFRNY